VFLSDITKLIFYRETQMLKPVAFALPVNNHRKSHHTMAHTQPQKTARLNGNDDDAFESIGARTGLILPALDDEELNSTPFILSVGSDLNDASAQTLVQQLNGMERWYMQPDGTTDTEKVKQKPIQFVINCLGGSASSLFSILDKMEALKTKGIRLETYVTGQAFSGGAVLASAGTKGHRYIAPRAFTMLHQAAMPAGETDKESVQSALAQAQYGATQNQLMMDALLTNTHGKVSKARLWQDTQQDLFLNAQQTIDYGLADHIGQLTMQPLLTPEDASSTNGKNKN
jgi:ATP-dependent Clp protease, protease subunit